MIRLHRPVRPRVLARRAATATAALHTAWSQGKTPNIKESLYGHHEVKTALRTVQYHKCAYCETRDVRSPGAVEHFRPKAGWRQRAGESLQSPGYFWLTYEWENLLFACTMCNDAGHKGNCFPLSNPRGRATPTHPDHTRERPLLLNPYERNDPERHIAWSAHIPKVRGNSRRGRTTITVFALDKDALLIDKRRDLLQSALFAVTQAERLAPGSAKRRAMHAVLLEHLNGSKEYTAMMRANLGDRIRAL